MWWGAARLEDDRRNVRVPTGFNVRDMGGYAADGTTTVYRRFLRSGSTSDLSLLDARSLVRYGVATVVDLRGDTEVAGDPDVFARWPHVTYAHVPVYDFDLRDPALAAEEGGEVTFYASGYLTMLANREAMRRVFEAFAAAPKGTCTLFHCAAGMDRTGVVAMLLLGLVCADSQTIVADYCYSFSDVDDIDDFLATPDDRKGARAGGLLMCYQTMRYTYDRLVQAYGSAADYLRTCGVSDDDLTRVRDHLLTP